MKAFGLACMLGAALAKNHHQNYENDTTEQQTPVSPTNNLWEEYWGAQEGANSLGSAAKCWGCTLAMVSIDRLLETKFIHNGILDIATTVCILTGATGDRFKDCPDFVHQFGEPMFGVIEQYMITRDRICNEYMGWCQNPTITPIDVNDVIDSILATKPAALKNDDYIQKLYEEIAQSTEPRPTLRALHLSDVHLDFEYTPGTVSNCGEYLCCHIENGYPKKASQIAAGEWGSPMCDIPVKTFQSMLDHLSAYDMPDLVFWTGDNSAHDVWDNTADESVSYTVKVSQMIADTFAGKNVTVLPIQGNHDTWVEEYESFAAPGINYEINNFKQYWQQWLTAEAYEKFGEYGYYSQPITLLNGKSLPEGTRVIAINTQTCNSDNIYVWGQREDPGHMFAWLTQELLDTEAQGGIAFIISHYTPNQCQHQFGSRYRALMERFQNVVRFTLHGHTHTTYFEMVQSYSNPGTPVMLANVAGSVTTYTVQNPSYMMIELDQATMLPINMYSYAMDLEKANASGQPTWELIHDYKETYGLADLSPQSMLTLSKRFLNDADLAATFQWNMHGQQGEKPTSTDQIGLHCLTASSEMWEHHECLESGATLKTKNGLGYSLWTIQGLVDWMISDWIKISID